MMRGIESVLLFSEDAKKLAKYYQEVVGLKSTLEAKYGEENEDLYGFEWKGKPGLYIMHHKKVKGKNKQPERMFFNLEVDDIKKEVARLKKVKAKLVADIYHVEDYGFIATFEDIDGNYFQFVQVRAS